MKQHFISSICIKLFVLVIFSCTYLNVSAQMGIENLPLTAGSTCDPLTFNRFTGSYHSNLYIGNQVGTNVLLAWGQNMNTYTTGAASPTDILSPTFVSTSSYSGVPYEVKSASTGGATGPSVMGLRTSTNLYIFGDMTMLSGITSMASFGGPSLIDSRSNVSLKLPTGITIGDIAQFEISPTAIAIVTKLGHVYILTKVVNLQGDKALAGPSIWHHVTLSNGTTFLSGVVKFSLSNSGAFALTSNGRIYYWGAPANVNGTVNTGTFYNYAYDMSAQIPAGITVVDIVTLSSSSTALNTLFILGNNLRVYSCGINTDGVLGISNTSVTFNQPNFQMISLLSNIVRIDGDTEAGLYTMGAMSTSGNVYGWGNGVASMLGVASQNSLTKSTNSYPIDIYNVGGFSDFSISGHFTIAFHTNLALNVDQYWYVGHNIGGSIGIPSNTTTFITNAAIAKLDAPATISFDCSNTQPTITVAGTLNPYITCSNSASATQILSILGTSLTNDIIITAPTGFEVSLTAGSGYANSINLTGTGGTITSTNVYIRVSAAGSGTVSGNLVLSSIGANSQSIPVSATINPLPVIALTTGAARTGPGSLTLSGTVTPASGTTIDWYANPTGGTALLASSLTYNTGLIASTTTYFAEARFTTTGCVSSARTPVVATINGTLFAGSISSNQSYCVGQPLIPFSSILNASGGTGTISYQWQLSTDNITFTNILTATNTVYNPVPPTQTTYYRRVASTMNDGAVFSNTITIVVNPKPVVSF